MEPQPDYIISFWGARCYMIDDPDEAYLWGVNWLHDVLLTVVNVPHKLLGLDYRFRIIEVYRQGWTIKEEEEEG